LELTEFFIWWKWDRNFWDNMIDSWYVQLDSGNIMHLQVLLQSANCQHCQPFHSIRVISFFFAAVWMICQLVCDVKLSNWIFCSRFQIFAAFYLLYSSFFVIPRRLNFICWRFGTLCPFHLQRRCKLLTPPQRWNWQCSETSAYKIKTLDKRYVRYISYRSRRFEHRTGPNSKLQEATTQWHNTALPEELIAQPTSCFPLSASSGNCPYCQSAQLLVYTVSQPSQRSQWSYIVS
jgi:hypothetical protein